MASIKIKIINDIIAREGGYVNHPSDRGGATMYGITEKVARANGYTGPMNQLPRDLAYKIYENEYWNINRLSDIEALSVQIAGEVADTGVNMGTNTAAKFLQRCLNVFNRQQRDYKDLVVDGKIGNATITALTAFLSIRKADGITVMLRALNSLQGQRYIALAENNPTQEDFVFGWFRERVVI